MRPTGKGTCEDTEQSPDLTIDHLPGEVLLEIFDYYRQAIDPYDHQWRERYVWFSLTQVCRKWRAVMFASSSRLDLGITVGPQKPGNIKTILSGPFPILIDYKCRHEDINGSALWRLRAALRHHDRVRKIFFEGTSANFKTFFRATNCPFPVLESLVLKFIIGDEAKLPDTFLRGPDLSVLHLRRLQLSHISFKSASGFLLSATTLTDLCLRLLGYTSETALLACLQGMPCLRSLDLQIEYGKLESRSQQPPTPVPLSKLSRFLYVGPSVFMDALAAGLSAPSLQDVKFEFHLSRWLSNPIVHLPRFIDGIEEHYHAVDVAFLNMGFHLSLFQPEYIGHCKPRLKLGLVPGHSPTESIIRISSALSARLAAVEELCVAFDMLLANIDFWMDYIPWRRFYQQFPSVKVLRADGTSYDPIARTLLRAHKEHNNDLTFFPALEEIEIGKHFPYLDFEVGRGLRLGSFQPFVLARQKAGRPVKVSFSP